MRRGDDVINVQTCMSRRKFYFLQMILTKQTTRAPYSSVNLEQLAEFLSSFS